MVYSSAGRYTFASTFPVAANEDVARVNSSTSSMVNRIPVTGQVIVGYASSWATLSSIICFEDFIKTTFCCVMVFLKKILLCINALCGI